MNYTPKMTPRGGQTNTEKKDGRPGGTRTPNMRFWRPPLYQLELLTQNWLVEQDSNLRISCLTGRRLTAWLSTKKWWAVEESNLVP